MLSFMRDQELPDAPADKPHAADKPPAGGDESTREQDYLTVASKSKTARKTTCLLVALFVIGLVGLVFMIKKSAPKAANAANTVESQIETAMARLTGIKSEMFSRMDQIVNKFYEFSDVQQINVNELVKNPFEHDMFEGELEIPDTDNADSDLMRQKARSLVLLGIMQSGQRNCCMIDDKILYEGDSIRGFKVRQIGDSFVRLELNKPQTENVEIVLKLSE
ncbi:MAG: hypothetical protein ACYS4W_09100 [Planctomycetota bacterium]|jgi:preprotein translocase subunit SecG